MIDEAKIVVTGAGLTCVEALGDGRLATVRSDFGMKISINIGGY